MASPSFLLTDVLLAPKDPPWGGAVPLSLGLRLATGETHWGEVALPANAGVAAVYALREQLAAALCGQPLDGLGDVAHRVRAVAAGSAEPLAGALAGGAQWAYLAAVQTQPDALEHLRREYGLSQDDPSPACYAEISDFAATAERIDQLFALRPAAIGYRLTSDLVAEAIGSEAEHLQRFVRELGRRAEMLSPGERYAPSIYLGLNGALGRLVDDPVHRRGKMLANVVGLHTAAGERQVILEEPLHLDDPMEQAANMAQLKDFIRRTPTSLQRKHPTHVVAVCPLAADEAQVYADTVAAHGFVANGLSDNLHQLLDNLARGQAAGLDTYWHLPAGATSRQIATVVYLARVTAARAVVVSGDEGDAAPLLVTRLLAETAALE